MRPYIRLATTFALVFAFLSVGGLILQVSAATTYFSESSYSLGGENGVEAQWWDSSWHYRVRFNVYSGDYDRIDVPVERTINFTSLLEQSGAYEAFDENSVRVVEYSDTGEVLREVPSQFDKAFDYDADFKAVGSIAWIMDGITPVNTTRIYYVYFDILRNGAKSPPSYTGVSHKISGDYVLLQNEKINFTIRFKNGVRMEELYLDGNQNGFFEPNEEMIGKDNPDWAPGHVVVRVTDEEMRRRGWVGSAGFWSSHDEEANLTLLKDGPILKEIMLSDISLKNNLGEACGVTIDQTFQIYKLGTMVHVRTVMTASEELEVSYSYETEFLDHKDVYDRWYVDENYNGKFTYALDYAWGFSGIPTYGFLTTYNSSGNAGIAFIPNVSYYSKASIGEYRDVGPAIRLGIHSGTWPAGKRIELENKLFAYLGDWPEAKRATQSINNPPQFIDKLRVHCVDSKNTDLNSVEVRVCNSLGDVVRSGVTNSTGWVIFDSVPLNNYVVKAFWKGQQVGNKTVSIMRGVTIDPFECAVYSLSVHTFAVNRSAVNEVMVGVYLLDGTRISNAIQTNSSGSAFFRQLPTGDYVIKTYRRGQQFGEAKFVNFDKDTALEIYEALGLGPPQIFRHEVVYALLIAALAVTVVVIIQKKGYEKIKFGLLLSILILVLLLAVAYTSGGDTLYSSNYLGSGISSVYNSDTGFVTVGDIVRLRWKDIHRNGSLDDWYIYVGVSSQSELAKIDLRTSLVTPVEAYSLYEAETRNVFYLDKVTNNYSLYKPLLQEPDFTDNIHYRRNLRLKFSFYKSNRWEVNVFCRLEQGKPYVQIGWEIIDKGEGAGNYSLYPQIIPAASFNRLVLPANYTANKLRYWNQKNGPTYGNPWSIETDFSASSGYIGTMHVNNTNLYLHSSVNYKTEMNIHASSAFSRHTNWVYDTSATPAYFQYDFWVDWDGEVPPSSDIRIEVWVPDVLDLSQSKILYSPDGSTWTEYRGWTMIEGNRGDSGFTKYGGSRHRLQIIFPADSFAADDGVDTGTDYGSPFLTKNDEYLVRLKVAYLNEGSVTYEFEDSTDTGYGLRNMNDGWMWLIGSTKDSWSVGMIPSKRMNYLACQVKQTELYRNITMGIRGSLTNDSKTSFHTNLIFFTRSQAASQDLDSDGVWNMFDDDLPPSFPLSALFGGRESMGEVVYEEWGFDDTVRGYYWVFSRSPLINDWSVSPQFTVCLPKEIGQHLESDDALFRFERYGYYIYDVSQSNEIRWMEKTSDTQSAYQLYAAVGLAAIGFVLSMKCKRVVRNYWLVLLLFVVGLSIRLCFQSLSPSFFGTDAASYGNVAANFLGYGKFQTNFLGMEPHYVRVGLLPSDVTRPFVHMERLLYPVQIVSAFMIAGKSFSAIKSVDVICGSLLILPTFFLSRKLFGEKTAVIATIIVVFHPLLIYYSGVHPSTNILPALFGTVALCSMLYESKKAAVVTSVSTVLLFFGRFEYGMILAVTIFMYHVIVFKRDFWKGKNFQVIMIVLVIGLSSLLLWSYFVYGRLLMFSTRILGGGFGEVQAPTLLETLTNPDFVQIRLYNALYGWWHLIYQDSPFIFVTALLGLLVNIKQWRKLSSLYLFPCFAILFYSFSIRTQPQGRFIVQYLPLLSILSAAFIIRLSNVLSGQKLHQSKRQSGLRFRHSLLLFVFVEIILMSFFSRYLLINTAMRNWTWKFNGGEVYHWISVNTSPNSVIMASSPVYTFYTGRETVDIPTPMGASGVDLDMIILIIKRYNINYLVLDNTARSVSDLRKILEDPLTTPLGFNLVHWTEDPTAFNPRLLIYNVEALHT